MSLVKSCHSVRFNPLLVRICLQNKCVLIFLIRRGGRWWLGDSWATSWLVPAQASWSLLFLYQHHLLFSRISPHSPTGRCLWWYLTQKCMHILRHRWFLMLYGDKSFKGPLTPLGWHLLLLSWHEYRDLIKVIWHLLAELLLLEAGIHLLEAAWLAIGEIAWKLSGASYLEGRWVEGLAVGGGLGQRYASTIVSQDWIRSQGLSCG